MYNDNRMRRGDGELDIRAMTDLQNAFHELACAALPQRKGIFRALVWPSEAARDQAERYLMATRDENRDDAFWSRYLGYCSDVRETPNVAVNNGLANMLQLAANITGGSPLPFSQTYTFLGVGNGMVYTSLAAPIGPGDNTITVFDPVTNFNTYGLQISSGDVLTFTDQTTVPSQTSPSFPLPPTNAEYAKVLSVASPSGSPATRVITLSQPVRFSRLINTYVLIAGRATAIDLSASGTGALKAYKQVAASYPVYSLVNSLPTLTWQANYTTTEATFQWTEACIGSCASPPASAVSTIPGSSTLLAKTIWYPSPLVKGSTLASQQYLFSLG